LTFSFAYKKLNAKRSFFSAIQRLADPAYLPTEEDVLRARLQSTGITETRFNVGGLPIHMFDVGGQRNERRKWMHCFERCVAFVLLRLVFNECSLQRNEHHILHGDERV
jgi:hypothetical protein